MKRFALYLSVSILTHIIGFTAVWLTGFLSNANIKLENVPKISEEVDVVTMIAPPKTLNSLMIFEPQLAGRWIPMTAHSKSLRSLSPTPKFIPTARGCGMRYVQSYTTNTNQWLREGTSPYMTSDEARMELDKLIKQAKQIVARVPKSKNRWGDLGERIMLLNPPDENGEESVSILWYGGGNLIIWIDAETLPLALEFERTKPYAY